MFLANKCLIVNNCCQCNIHEQDTVHAHFYDYIIKQKVRRSQENPGSSRGVCFILQNVISVKS